MRETAAVENEWTKEHLQKLLAAMKSSVPAQVSARSYRKGLRTLNWDKVAFPPFSPEECQKKWTQMFEKMRKHRSLTELLVEAEDVVSHGKQYRLHPEAPEKPLNSSAYFIKKNYSKYKRKHPDLTRAKIFKELFNDYNVLPDEKKARYVEKSKFAKENYASKMQVFSERQQIKTAVRKRKPQKKKKLSEDTPDGGDAQPDQGEQAEYTEALPSKPPISGYRLFCQEQSEAMSGFSGESYVTVWAQRWRALTPNQREEYNKRWKESNRRYMLELKTFLNSFDEEKQEQILKENGIKRSAVSKDKKRQKKTFLGEPKMWSRSTYSLFYKQQMQNLKEKMPNSRDRMSKINKMWHNLSRKEMEHYNKEFDKDHRKYALQLQMWLKTLKEEEQQRYLHCNPSKIKFLGAELEYEHNDKGAHFKTSDSEDEDIDISSSDGEENNSNFEVEEEEEEEEEYDVITFEMF